MAVDGLLDEGAISFREKPSIGRNSGHGRGDILQVRYTLVNEKFRKSVKFQEIINFY
jgi:hypothetical protein